jgi:AmmeMemoRadiSam system protein B
MPDPSPPTAETFPLPDRPRLRPLEAFPVERDGERYLCLRDPSGLSEQIATLPPAAVAIVQLCDGDSTPDEICAEFGRRYRSPLERTILERLLLQLDTALLLDSARFAAHSARVFGDFQRSPTRAPYHAGKSYPLEAGELAASLDATFDPPRGPGRPRPGSRPLPRAIVAPHIDFPRGGPAYAWAYRALADAAEAPELVILFGTDHNGVAHPFTFTRKHYQTPLGPLETDVAFVDAVAGELAAQVSPAAARDLFAEEHHHRGEHSLEFQMVWLRHALGARADRVKVVPILCGSLHRFVEGAGEPAADRLIAAVFAAIERQTQGRRTLYVAGADLAHVGPRFGDPDPLDKDDSASLERRDQETLRVAARGDASGWFGEIRREGDRRRVCGLPPIYALLAVARPREGSGAITSYAQCAADDDGGSLVSIASLVYAD